MPYFEDINGVHDRVFLGPVSAGQCLVPSSRVHTAIPANAPAVMFAASEKCDGSPS
jgi:hypothetical protein